MRIADALPAVLSAAFLAAGLLQAHESESVPHPSSANAELVSPAQPDTGAGTTDTPGVSTGRSTIDLDDIQLSAEDLNRSNRLPSSDPTLEPQVQQALKFFRTRARPSIQQALARQAVYGPIVREAFERQGVPEWVAGLAMVESHYNPSARSPAGYTGMWQMSSDTARNFGLKVGRGVDERMDPRRSTEAVARLLAHHYRQFNDWNLVLAAYAAGEMRVRRALEKRPGADLPELVRRGLLPGRLLSNVANVQAASRIIEAPETHGFRSVGRDLADDLVDDTARAMEAVSSRP